MKICEDAQKRIQKHLKEILNLRSERRQKEDGSYITSADLLCQSIIFDYLSSLKEKFEIISEEVEIDEFTYDTSKNYVVLDPLDGTENFTSGLKEWGVSLSIYIKNRHYESMIMIPEMGLSLKTGEKAPHYQSRIHGLSSSLKKEHFSSLEDGKEYRIMGCAVYNLYNVITGSFCTFENPKGTRAWDILAGLNLALERGLEVSVNEERYLGEFLDPSQKYRFTIQWPA